MFGSLRKDRVSSADDNFRIIARLQPDTGRHLESRHGFPLLAQAKRKSLAQFARWFLSDLPGPGRVQEQVTAGRGGDNPEDHIDPARLCFKEPLIANLSRQASYPPTEKSD
jgi:hypothetical protein